MLAVLPRHWRISLGQAIEVLYVRHMRSAFVCGFVVRTSSVVVLYRLPLLAALRLPVTVRGRFSDAQVRYQCLEQVWKRSCHCSSSKRALDFCCALVLQNHKRDTR